MSWGGREGAGCLNALLWVSCGWVGGWVGLWVLPTFSNKTAPADKPVSISISLFHTTKAPSDDRPNTGTLMEERKVRKDLGNSPV